MDLTKYRLQIAKTVNPEIAMIPKTRKVSLERLLGD
jgi:hypothetical protein